MRKKSGVPFYRRTTLTLAFVFTIGLLVYAHHGWAEFDQTQEISVTGVVEEPTFEYPHTRMTLKADDDTWDIVMAPPRRLNRMGVDEKNLKDGMTVTVTGHPHRENEKMMRIFEILIDGETLSIR